MQAAPSVTIKKKVDDRVKQMIDDAVANKHRGVVLLVGDRGRDQIVNLHTMISRAQHNAKVNMLWCLKSDPEFGSTGKKGLERKGALEVKGGMATEQSKENFQTWMQQTQIRFCLYKESHKVLGQTFGMAVLQDFEAITPNVLARTIETVAGGGLIVIMLRAMSSLKQLYTLVMDVHSRYRTESLRDVVPRFNERFLLSLADCPSFLCVDDDLNVLPFTSNMKNFAARKKEQRDEELVLSGRLKHEADLQNLKDRLKNVGEIGPIVQMCQTVDQARSVLGLMQAVSEKTLSTTCVVTAGRGRGKSTALGIAAAGAIAAGYSNIFITAPSPDNVQTLFEFAVKGLVELGYRERVEFEAMQSTNPDFAKCVIRINVFKGHRQTIQFIAATDAEKMAQAELLIIDEAAALPLTLVKKMMGPYLIFLSSTISGYEGSGRSLSMKLVADMRKHNGTVGGRGLKEISLQDPIRYGPNDHVEKWLTKLLCLEATEAPVITRTSPHPSACELYYVSRDALFSYHPKAEAMLHQVVSLLVAAHYKNQPNDLQLMSDAPGHHLFVLCSSSLSGNGDGLPDVFAVIHACEEGQISSDTLQSNLSRGARPSGDLIPYTLAQQYLEEGFAKLAGLRVVRIATNPDFQRAGYGTRALQLLTEYYRGNIAVNSAEDEAKDAAAAAAGDEEAAAATQIEPRKKIPSLLTPLHRRPYEAIDYIGVSYGVTTELYNFWNKNGFEPLYLRQIPNELTGEHSCVMVRPFGFDIQPLRREFTKRFINLCALSYRNLPVDLALSIVTDLNIHTPQTLAAATAHDRSKNETIVGGVRQIAFADLQQRFSTSELQRVKMCTTAYLDTAVVLDLIPALAKIYFSREILKTGDNTDGVVLSHAQAAVLLGVGLQCHAIDDLAAKSAAFHGVPAQQLRSFFAKAIARIAEHFNKLRMLRIESIQQEREAEVAAEDNSDDAPRTAGQKAGRSAGDEALLAAHAADSATERITEQRDAKGNVIGMSIARVVKKDVETDRTLLRDAKSTTGDVSRKSSSTRGASGPAKKVLRRK